MNELGMLSGTEQVVSIVSGSGLKDIKSASLAAGKAKVVAPDMDEVRKAVTE
jgi:threonine synthase